VHEARQEQEDAILPLLAGGTVNPLETALMTDPVPPLEQLPDGATDEVAITEYEPDEITLSANLGASGLLVLSEVYDPGWEVLIDGEEADLIKVDALLRAIAVPAGSHEIEFHYQPAVLWVGTTLTGATLGVFLFGAVGLRLRSRFRGGVAPWPRRRGMSRLPE
jgi:hypothetical protein